MATKFLPQLFQTDIKTGANPELANLDNVRFAFMAEPKSSIKFCTATIKDITGSSTLAVRTLYSKKVGIKLVLTLAAEMNSVPQFDEMDQAVNRRVICTVFESQSKAKGEYDLLSDEERENTILQNPHYKTLA
jgi:phage/plasmid-associated DNA primase